MLLKSQGFPRTNRILHKKEYDNIIFKSSSVKRRGFLIFFKPNNCRAARLGISVPKKIFSNSVDRNAVKRLVRESFRLRKLFFANLDLVVLINQKLILRDLKSELQEGLDYLQEYWQSMRIETDNVVMPNFTGI